MAKFVNVIVCLTRLGTEEEYAAIDVVLQHVADLATEYSYRPPRSAVRTHACVSDSDAIHRDVDVFFIVRFKL